MRVLKRKQVLLRPALTYQSDGMKQQASERWKVVQHAYVLQLSLKRGHLQETNK